MSTDLADNEIDLLVDGLTDDVVFVWVLIDLGLPPTRTPTAEVVAISGGGAI